MGLFLLEDRDMFCPLIALSCELDRGLDRAEAGDSLFSFRIAADSTVATFSSGAASVTVTSGACGWQNNEAGSMPLK
jgi:hypothetical protein